MFIRWVQIFPHSYKYQKFENWFRLVQSVALASVGIYLNWDFQEVKKDYPHWKKPVYFTGVIGFMLMLQFLCIFLYQSVLKKFQLAADVAGDKARAANDTMQEVQSRANNARQSVALAQMGRPE